MTSRSRGIRQRGFTLIELLIVFSIIGVLGAIVSPYASQAMKRARAAQERMVIERTVERLAFRSYTEGRGVTLEGRGSRLTWTAPDEPRRTLDLEYSFFDPEQVVFINSSGLADRDALNFVQGGRARRVDLNGWLQEK